jgi:hypothetical protein
MNLMNWMARITTVAALTLAVSTAAAAPVTMKLQGSVTGYVNLDLSAGLPLGAAVNLSLTFNDTFSDGSYDFSDNLGPVSGSMTVGSASFTFNDYRPLSQRGGFGGFPLEWVEPMFTGTGPALGTGELFGLFAMFTPALTLFDDLLLGYGFTTAYPGGLTVTSYGYARITPDSYTITPASPVSAPATLSLVMLALAAAGWSRRRA